jgi:hypothetical protein
MRLVVCFDFINLLLLNVCQCPEQAVRFGPARSAADPSWSASGPRTDPESERDEANRFASGLINGFPMAFRVRRRNVGRRRFGMSAWCIHKYSRVTPVRPQNPVSVRVLFSLVRASKIARWFRRVSLRNSTFSICQRARSGRIELAAGRKCFEVNCKRRWGCYGIPRASRESHSGVSDRRQALAGDSTKAVQSESVGEIK